MASLTPQRSIIDYLGDGLCPATVSLLTELGFVTNGQQDTYYCPEEDWTITVFANRDVLLEYPPVNGFDDAEEELREDGFPVDRILRLKRLRALIS